jgi:hypothetical protein
MRFEQPSIVTILSLLTSLLLFLTPQTQTRVIEWSKSPVGSNNENVAPILQLFRQIEGVEIIEFASNGKPVSIGEPFAAPEDWLKKLTVRVRNISAEKLESVQITLKVPEIGVSPDVIYCYGCGRAEREKGIQPGEIVELTMPGGEYYEWVVSRIEAKLPLSKISRAEIRHMYVGVPDRPTWYSGCVRTANPKEACQFSTP